MSLDLTLHGEMDTGRGPIQVAVYDTNITHNLTNMASEAGFYGPVWRPEENGVETADDLIAPLAVGIAAMKADPQRFKKFDAENGWGTYEQFLPWLEELLAACQDHPKATVEASR